jgi:hypothetical protein
MIIELSIPQRYVLALALLLLESLLFQINRLYGNSIDVSPLFVVPVVIAGFYLSTAYCVAFALISGVTQILMHRDAINAIWRNPINLAFNFALAICGYFSIVLLMTLVKFIFDKMKSDIQSLLVESATLRTQNEILKTVSALRKKKEDEDQGG